MTRRNDKRNNRHYRQHNNKTEFSPFASMLFGALISKGTEMIAKKMAEEGKLMVQKKQEQESAPDTKNGDPITYDDICKELFFGKNAYWVRNNEIKKGVIRYSYSDIDNYTSLAQAKRTLAFNKLQNIAKYLNDGWKPNFNGNQKNWNIIKDDDTFVVMFTTTANKACVYFKSEDLTKEAIRLMGEESLNDLFSTDW